MKFEAIIIRKRDGEKEIFRFEAKNPHLALEIVHALYGNDKVWKIDRLFELFEIKNPKVHIEFELPIMN